jgi:hypothetical protein
MLTTTLRLDPRWLALKEAAHYSAIGEARLISMAKAGAVKGFQDQGDGRRGWIFDRLSLDAYREAQALQPTYREKALAIFRGLSL